MVQAVQNVPVVQAVKNRFERFERFHELDLPQRENFWIDIAVPGDPSLVAQHSLSVSRKNEAHQEPAGVRMRGRFGQCGRMDVRDHGLIEDVLDRSALSFDARDDVSVGIGDHVKLAGSEKLGGDIMSIAQAGLLLSQSLEESSGFFLANTVL